LVRPSVGVAAPAGGRFLEPVASYRSRCDRPSSTFAGRHGAGVISARPHLCLKLEAYQVSIHIVTRDTPHPQPALGRAIRRLREDRDLSLRTFAPRAGVTFNTLSLIERGEANPTWETIKGIAAALDVPISELAKLAEKHEEDEKPASS